jgi:hypothetical protein
MGKAMGRDAEEHVQKGDNSSTVFSKQGQNRKQEPQDGVKGSASVPSDRLSESAELQSVERRGTEQQPDGAEQSQDACHGKPPVRYKAYQQGEPQTRGHAPKPKFVRRGARQFSGDVLWFFVLGVRFFLNKATKPPTDVKNRFLKNGNRLIFVGGGGLFKLSMVCTIFIKTRQKQMFQHTRIRKTPLIFWCAVCVYFVAHQTMIFLVRAPYCVSGLNVFCIDLQFFNVLYFPLPVVQR